MTTEEHDPPTVVTLAEAGAERLPRTFAVLLPTPRRSAWTAVFSLLLHVVLIGLLVFGHWRALLTWAPALRAGDPSITERGGGGGGGGIREIALPAYRPPATPVAAPVIAPPVAPTPVPVVAPPPPTQAAVVDTTASPSAAAGQGGTGTGGGSGSGTGTGQGSGTGAGRGPGTGPGTGGEAGKGIAPEPRQLILPPLDYPRSLRGRTIAVTFWVNTDGRVERVALDPDMEDRGFQRKFVEVMRNYRFRPARSAEGVVIPGTTTVSITF